MPRKDRDSRLAYAREYYQRRMADPEFKRRNLDRIAANNERYAAEARALLAEFKARGCLYCDEREPVCLDAHHRDPTTKRYAIADAGTWGERATKQFAAELAKCDCVCRNCHAKLHAGILK